MCVCADMRVCRSVRVSLCVRVYAPLKHEIRTFMYFLSLICQPHLITKNIKITPS